ncbi:hypothetical protein [Haloarchaeobius amylolyticus]|uniref:hypothetical protein n=1 Tax=Haloarchaeobius amylolyticus TaxID=1198296 RepID=UPI002270053F|nr:hypothetical protein [Haloarchaeobius amylolyticus]
MSEDAPESTTDEGPSEPFTERVERSFTCSLCGYATTYEVEKLQDEVRATCLNCGDWTVQFAAPESLVDAAEDVADALAGETLTERQALAYLLRDVVGVDRQLAADAMETTPSNVDNLQRRGREKVADARRVVGRLQEMEQPTGGEGDGSA